MSEFGEKVESFRLERDNSLVAVKVAEDERLLAVQKVLDTAKSISQLLIRGDSYPDVIIHERTTKIEKRTFRKPNTIITDKMIGSGWFLERDKSPQNDNSGPFLHSGFLLSTLGDIISYEVYDVRDVIKDDIYFNPNSSDGKKNFDIRDESNITEPKIMQNRLAKFVVNRYIDYSTL